MIRSRKIAQACGHTLPIDLFQSGFQTLEYFEATLDIKTMVVAVRLAPPKSRSGEMLRTYLVSRKFTHG